MKLQKTGVFKFELLCVDSNQRASITTERGLKYNLMSNEKIWKDAVYDDRYLEDRKLGIKLYAEAINQADSGKNGFARTAFKITMVGVFDVIESLRYEIVQHIKSMNFDKVFVLTDEISENIAQNIYPQINKVENALRKYLIMWLEEQGQQSLSDAFMVWKSDNRNASLDTTSNNFIALTDNRVYQINFHDLGEMADSTNETTADYDQIINLIEEAEEIGDLQKIKDYIRANSSAGDDILQRGYFKQKWQALSRIRQKTVDNHLLVLQDYVEAEKLIDELLITLDDATNQIFEPVKPKITIERPVSKPVYQSPSPSFNPMMYILTEEELLKAFDETQHWASRTADGFVGLKHFLVNVLGNKRGFAYAPSAAMVNALVDRGVFEIFDVPSNSGGAYNVKAIRRKSVMPI